jgi:hypothetical protein
MQLQRKIETHMVDLNEEEITSRFHKQSPPGVRWSASPARRPAAVGVPDGTDGPASPAGGSGRARGRRKIS